MKTKVSLLMLAALLFAGTAFAADPIVGSWKLNVAKSKFTAGQELKSSSRVYTEANGVYTLDQKLTGADGKEISLRTEYSDGKEMKQDTGGPLMRPTPRRSMRIPGTSSSRKVTRSLDTSIEWCRPTARHSRFTTRG